MQEIDRFAAMKQAALIILIVTLNLFQGLSYGQQVNLDSLWTVWNDEEQADTARLKAIHDIAVKGYLFTQPDSAFYFARLEYDFAKSKGLKKYMAKALNTQGVFFENQDDYATALDYYTRSLTIYEELGNKKSIAIVLNNIGFIYKQQGDYAKAIDCYMSSLTIYEETGYKKGIAYCLIGIGNIYMNQGDYATALDYFTRSLTIEEEIGNKKGIANSLNDIGNVYYEQGDYATAIDYFTRSLTIKEEIGNKKGIANSLSNIGNVYYRRDDYATALDYYTRSLTIYEELGNKSAMSISLNNIGCIYDKQGDYATAIDYCTRALSIAQKIGIVDNIRAFAESLYESYKATGNHRKALEMHELHIVMRDSIKNEENRKEVMRQQFKYDYEKKEAVAQAEHQSESKRQQLIIWAVSGGLLLLVAFAFFIVNRLRITRRQKIVIEEQKEEVDRAYDSLEEKNTEIMDSIQYAKRIQNAILPPQKLVKQYLEESFILYKPKDIVAGDFYWMETAHPQPLPSGGEKKVLPDGEDSGGAIIFFTAADCTGHGVPGAMVSVMCSTALSKAVKELGIYEPAKILDKTVELLEERFSKSEEEVKDGMDLALCCLNTKTNELQYAGANNPLYHLREGEINEIKADKQPIGSYEGRKPFTNHRIELRKGDSIYIFSDGFADQFGGPKGKKFKYKPFRELLLANQDKPMEEQKQLLDEAIENWRGDLEQVDDVCVIGVRV